MVHREALGGGGACYSERTDWTFGAGETSTLESDGDVAGAPELPFVTRWATCAGYRTSSGGVR
jgi:hypothetical protein